jgi:hypothetical protein
MENPMNSAVDRETARQHLELANKHVAGGERRVEAQTALLAKLKRDGHDTTQAIAFLEQLERTLALQVQTRERIVGELGRAD